MREGPVDHTLLACVVSLLALGMIMVFSASAGSALARSQDKFHVIRLQIVWTVVGVFVMGIASRVDYRQLRPFARPLLAIAFVLLALVYVPGMGRTRGGATRWIELGFVGVQPSEVAKLALVLFLADFLTAKGRDRSSFMATVFPCLCVLLGMCVLVLKQPNLSYTLILFTVGFLMIWLQYTHWKHMVGIGLLGVAGAFVLVVTEPYRLRRYLAFLDPWGDPYGSGWNIIQSLYALASGGLWGLGIGRGRQKFEYLPQEHSDYIFAVLGEELGFLGAAAVILLFAVILWRGLRIAARAPDEFGALIAYGLTMLFTIQAIVNVSVVVGAIPPTGIPLPFISYGGSSLVASMAAAGMLLSISRVAHPGAKRRHLERQRIAS